MEALASTTDLERRASLHRALGDPLRLAIVDALVLSDLTPSEVEERFGVPSNLLAHHLGILEDAGVVRRTRSQGDGRRRYLSLDARALAVLDTRNAPLRTGRVVFVCTRNSARSPLASALWKAARPDIPTTSAGTHPAEAVHPLAAEAGRRGGLTIEHTPQSVEGLAREGDLIVTVCDQAHEESPGALHWSIPDPVREGRPEAFARTVDQLRDRIHQLAEQTAGASWPEMGEDR